MSKFKFIIVGTGRSGTSLLASLLDTHPDIHVEFELFAEHYLRGKGIAEHQSTLFSDRAYGFLDACERVASTCRKNIWANKITTESIRGLYKHNMFNTPPIPVLNEFFDVVMQGKKVVFILRDGRSCIKSKMGRKPQPVDKAIDNWKAAVEFYRFLKDRDGTLCIKFEDLVSNTKSCLDTVFQFLEVESCIDIDQATRNKKMPSYYRRNSIDPGRALDLDNRYVTEIKDELKFCGYI